MLANAYDFLGKNYDSYVKTKKGIRIVVHCVSISASIDICIGFRKLKESLYPINKVV